MLVNLTKKGLVDGAKIATEVDMSFDEYCVLIAKILITGQSPGEVKVVLKSYEIDAYFNEEKDQTVINEIHSQKKM